MGDCEAAALLTPVSWCWTCCSGWPRPWRRMTRRCPGGCRPRRGWQHAVRGRPVDGTGEPRFGSKVRKNNGIASCSCFLFCSLPPVFFFCFFSPFSTMCRPVRAFWVVFASSTKTFANISGISTNSGEFLRLQRHCELDVNHLVANHLIVLRIDSDHDARAPCRMHHAVTTRNS